jgi:hypothetical protein
MEGSSYKTAYTWHISVTRSSRYVLSAVRCRQTTWKPSKYTQRAYNTNCHRVLPCYVIEAETHVNTLNRQSEFRPWPVTPTFLERQASLCKGHVEAYDLKSNFLGAGRAVIHDPPGIWAACLMSIQHRQSTTQFAVREFDSR